MITRKQAQKVVDQCNLISLLAKEKKKQQGIIKQARGMLESSHRTPLSFDERCHYLGKLRAANYYSQLCSIGIKWVNRGLSLLNGERKDIAANPALIWDRSRYNNPSVIVVLDAIEKIIKKP